MHLIKKDRLIAVIVALAALIVSFVVLRRPHAGERLPAVRSLSKSAPHDVNIARTEPDLAKEPSSVPQRTDIPETPLAPANSKPWGPWLLDENALKNHLSTLNPHPDGSSAAEEWLESKYRDFPKDAIPTAHRLIGRIGFDEVDIYIELRDKVGDYNSWIGPHGERPPNEARGDYGKYVSRYITSGLPDGRTEHRWYVFPPDGYPDVAARAAELNWVHDRVHVAIGNCPICNTGGD